MPWTPGERRWQRRWTAERTRRQRAESSAREWQDRFRLFLDHAPMPAFIRDDQGRHVYGNKPWAAQFDRPLSELLGKTNWELFPKETALVFEASDQAARLRGEVSGLLESSTRAATRPSWSTSRSTTDSPPRLACRAARPPASAKPSNLRYGAETFHTLKKLLQKRGLVTSVGDEGGFAPNLKTNDEAVEVIVEAIKSAGYKPGKDIAIALDPAASEFYDDGSYVMKKSDRLRKTPAEIVKLWGDWAKKYPIVSLEDGMGEEDRDGWKALTKALGKKLQLVGDDNFVTNPRIFAEGIRDGIANAILRFPRPERCH